MLKNYNIYLLVLKSYSKKTIKIYHNTADSFLYFLKMQNYHNVNQITKNTLYNFISHTRNNATLGTRTTNLLISSLNNFTKFLCEKYNCCKSQKLKHLKFMSKLPNIIDESEMLELLKVKNPIYDKQATWIQYRNYALVVLIYSSGLRISEATNMLLGDIVESGWVRVECGKGGKTRIVPINIHVLTQKYIWFFCPLL
ncbi:tyrosine-type recombinase/integrase [Sulfurimonas sp. NW9]|uniref:tyrosine-type recombinase/integrase n=2 Tax=Sulfurimonas TaxID=202746 RepID=UPI003DA7ADA8